jgi:hypothetical protein
VVRREEPLRDDDDLRVEARDEPALRDVERRVEARLVERERVLRRRVVPPLALPAATVGASEQLDLPELVVRERRPAVGVVLAAGEQVP